MDKTQVIDKMKADGIRYILAQFVDIHGAAKVKMVPVSEAESVIDDGAGFAGAAVWGMGQGPHSHDLMGRCDPDSYTVLPWNPEVARLAADIHVDDEPHPYCPRVNLRRMCELFKGEGFVFNAGMEPEFFLVKRNGDGGIDIFDEQGIDTLDKPCYDFKGISQAMPFLTELNDAMSFLGWGNYQTDHEDANGQYELNYGYSDALTIADRHTFVRMMIGQIAMKHGALATFMAKPFHDRTGSGAHLHFHVADAANGRNLFTNDGGNDPHGLGLSELAYHFIGGVIKHAKALCAVTSPTINCFKRIQIGEALYGPRSGYTWTPAFISYGDNNRTQMLRCPAGNRFEDRTVSAANNPYLTLAAYIGAGLDGIKNKLDPGSPNTGINMYEKSLEEHALEGTNILPQNQGEALEALEQDEVVRGALGPIAEEFMKIKRHEWMIYRSQVTPWEIKTYLTNL